MNTLERKKLNLLIHLAKVDGKFDKAERELLQNFLEEKGLVEGNLDEDEYPMKMSELAEATGRIELLYWAIKLAQADGCIHDKEILFCRNLADKLNFNPESVEHYMHKSLPDFSIFEQEMKHTWLKEL